jgi:uncharacterized repeat protein (TIGR03803 family)
MKSWKSLSALAPCVQLALIIALGVQSAFAANITVLHNFGAGKDGRNPYLGSQLIRDAEGNLYGTTAYGGLLGGGTMFEVTAGGVEIVLYNFGNTGEGAIPTSLIMDSNGNLFGTTANGGSGSGILGILFELTPRTGKYTVLHIFKQATGSNPQGRLLLDESGNLYGTTANGGASTKCLDVCGTVLKLTPTGTYTVLHSFTAGEDGVSPYAGLTMDGSGNLYGTTVVGGGSAECVGGCGTVFEISSSGEEKVLVTFSRTNGANPYASLVMDEKGNLDGTTAPWGSSRIWHRVCSEGRDGIDRGDTS